MHISRLLVVSVLALCVGGLLAACQRTGDSDVVRTGDGVLRLGSVEVVDTVSRAVAPSDRPLVLEGLRGSVHLTAADQATADLSFVRRGRGDSREEGQSVLQGITITESGTEAEYAYTLSAEDEDYAVVGVWGQVPRQTALQIERLSGTVHIDGVEGPLTINYEHGDVEVRGARAPVETIIKNGDVRVSFQSVPTEGPLLLETANGDIHLGIPPDASAQIDAQTNVGAIRTQGLSFTAEQFAPINAGARYDAQLGEGGPTIEMRTQNGSITLQARDTTQADTSEVGERPAPTVPSSDTTMAPQLDPGTTETDTSSLDTTAADTTF